jgi:transcriptional regulator with XRE-family HTH domain
MTKQLDRGPVKAGVELRREVLTRLRQLRVAGLTFRQISDATGISRAAVTTWARPNAKGITEDYALRFLETFGSTKKKVANDAIEKSQK